MQEHPPCDSYSMPVHPYNCGTPNPVTQTPDNHACGGAGDGPTFRAAARAAKAEEPCQPPGVLPGQR